MVLGSGFFIRRIKLFSMPVCLLCDFLVHGSRFKILPWFMGVIFGFQRL